MEKQATVQALENGLCVMGLELGSTRIKAVLVDEAHQPVAAGAHDWENKLENGVWTYHLEDVWAGVQHAYQELKQDVARKYGVTLRRVKSMGFSAMMHGYLPFDGEGRQLCGFRTWRNTMTEQAAKELTELFSFNIPQRWSIAHLYQAMLNNEPHVKDIAFLTTLAGYIHWQLTGQKALGVGEASGMFPIDSVSCDFDRDMIRLFDGQAVQRGYGWTLESILPKVLGAGEDAGSLTPKGAALLDPSGELEAGIPLCPPEGDAGTGMAATNSVAVRTGNVSAGTSVFAMVVLEKPLSKVYPEIDMVTTPTGKPVAMVHCNNCTSDINAWAGMLGGFLKSMGHETPMDEIFVGLFNAAMKGDKDCGGVVNCSYFSGEPITGLEEGRPMLVRLPDAKFSFANFARSLVDGAVVTLKLGMDILVEQEQVQIDSLLGHGGFFKTPGVGQSLLAAALKTPISVMETAGEGGPWGMALLAAYRVNRKPDETLEQYLSDHVFADAKGQKAEPLPEDAAGFETYAERFTACLAAEKTAVSGLKA